MAGGRRRFLKSALGAGAGLALAGRGLSSMAAVSGGKRILVLGGTRFLGPAVVNYAKERGHKLTLFNRGKSNPGLFPDLETLIGDRDGKLDALKGRQWDAVIDTSGYVPRVVKMSAELLAPNVKQYVFISSISVYAEPMPSSVSEGAKLATMEDPANEEVMKNYGALKSLCEKEASKAFPNGATNIRPGLIVGPEDDSDRFTYWPVRLSRGGDVLCPGDGTDKVQVIDVRDLGAWIVRMVEGGHTGTYNATGPEKPTTMKEMLESCKKGVKSDANLVWAPVKFLEQHEVAPWSDMPAWIPGGTDSSGITQVDIAKALAKGLKCRPVRETAADTLAWWNAEPAERRAKLRAGISPEREKEVLAALRAKG
jgi:2'-hydroxyisoflavone reductase